MTAEPTRDPSQPPVEDAHGSTRQTASSASESHTEVTASEPPRGPARYQFFELVAHGGMGSVYRAMDQVFNRPVAVKVLHPRYGTGSAPARRFIEEARITGQLQHPNIPAAHDLGTLDDGRPFLAMKLIRGQTLEDRLRERSAAGADRGELLAVFEQICHAVGFAHSHQVIHRDLKPSNVMVGAHGEVQVMDWGLAKVLRPAGDSRTEVLEEPAELTLTSIESDRDEGSETRAGSVLGTPGYMPPEQAIGAIDQVDARSDVFGLGAILCVILTGQAPYVGATSEAIRQLAARGKLDDAFTRLDACGVEPELIALCKQCLEPESSRRPADAGEVAKAVGSLRAAVEDRARQAELDRVKAEAEAREQRKRRRVQMAFAIVAAVLLLGIGGFAWYADRHAQAERQRREQASTAISTILDRAAEALAAEKPKLATEYLNDATLRAEESGISDHDERIDAYQKDRDMLLALAEVDAFRWTLRESELPPHQPTFPTNEEIAQQWSEAFASFEVAPEEPATAEMAQRVNSSAIRTTLLIALDGWLATKPSNGLRDLLLAVDPDPFRDEVRRALASRHVARINELANRTDWSDQPPGLVQALARSQALPKERQRSLLGDAIRHRPSDFGLLMQLAESYVGGSGEQIDERLRWYQAAVTLRPGNAVAHFNLGNALKDKKSFGAAIASYRDAIRIHPTYTQPHLSLGNTLRDAGDLDGAVSSYRNAIRIDPKYAFSHYLLGLALRDMKDFDHAVAAFRYAIQIDSSNGGFHTLLGLALRDNGDIDGAIAEWREALRIDPKDANVHYMLGNVLRDKGDLDGAVAAYREAVRHDPRNAGYQKVLGDTRMARGDIEEAIAAYEAVHKLDPGDEYALLKLNGWKRLTPLLPRLEAILAGTDRVSPIDLCHLGHACREPFLRRFFDSVRLYEQAFAADPKLADDLTALHRYNAACYAARAARGDDLNGVGEPAERAALRAKALDWLNAELVLRKKQAESSNAEDRKLAEARLSWWLADYDLVTVRPGLARMAMPADERAKWDAFWAEVRATIELARKPPAKKP